jgi:hypothetical protein
MSRTIKAVERHLVPPSARSDSTNASFETTAPVPLRRKPERKLRGVFAPGPLSALTTATK